MPYVYCNLIGKLNVCCISIGWYINFMHEQKFDWMRAQIWLGGNAYTVFWLDNGWKFDWGRYCDVWRIFNLLSKRSLLIISCMYVLIKKKLLWNVPMWIKLQWRHYTPRTDICKREKPLYSPRVVNSLLKLLGQDKVDIVLMLHVIYFFYIPCVNYYYICTMY